MEIAEKTIRRDAGHSDSTKLAVLEAEMQALTGDMRELKGMVKKLHDLMSDMRVESAKRDGNLDTLKSDIEAHMDREEVLLSVIRQHPSHVSEPKPAQSELNTLSEKAKTYAITAVFVIILVGALRFMDNNLLQHPAAEAVGKAIIGK